MDLLNRFINRLAFFAPGGSSLRPMLQRCRGVKIGRNPWISQYVYFDELHPEGIKLGNNVTIGLRVSIITHFYWGKKNRESKYREVIIEDDVFIGPHCLILPGVRIKKGAIIKGGTTVTREVPANTFWGAPEGKPLAKATIPLTPDHSFEEFINGLRPFRKNNSI